MEKMWHDRRDTVQTSDELRSHVCPYGFVPHTANSVGTLFFVGTQNYDIALWIHIIFLTWNTVINLKWPKNSFGVWTNGEVLYPKPSRRVAKSMTTTAFYWVVRSESPSASPSTENRETSAMNFFPIHDEGSSLGVLPKPILTNRPSPFL